MRGVLHTGRVVAQENGLLTFKAMDYNLPHLPKSFGGMSGGGVWRTYFEEDADGSYVVEAMLCGVTSWQIDATTSLVRAGIGLIRRLLQTAAKS
jgi:hypothetical protein